MGGPTAARLAGCGEATSRELSGRIQGDDGVKADTVVEARKLEATSSEFSGRIQGESSNIEGLAGLI